MSDTERQYNFGSKDSIGSLAWRIRTETLQQNVETLTSHRKLLLMACESGYPTNMVYVEYLEALIVAVTKEIARKHFDSAIDRIIEDTYKLSREFDGGEEDILRREARLDETLGWLGLDRDGIKAAVKRYYDDRKEE